MKHPSFAKSVFCRLTAMLTLFCLLFMPEYGGKAYAAGHTETTPYNWFFNKTDDHSQPAVGQGLQFTEDYKCYFVDRNADDKSPVIYLTFDVGYENGNVAKILDALKAHNAPGAFFILSHVAKKETTLVQRMLDEGHTVCNHTSRHPDMSAIRDKELFAHELQTLENEFLESYGQPIARYYRPPQGRLSEQNLRYAEDMGYRTILWSYAYADWDNVHQPDPEISLQKLLNHTHNGMVLLLHPTSTTNAAIMDRLLTEWEKAGYRFGSLDELCASMEG